MTSPATLMLHQPVPDLEAQTVSGGTWSLADQSAEYFIMVVSYRGLLYLICGNYMCDLDRKMDDFKAAGVEVVVIS